MDTPKELSALIKVLKMREQARGVDLDGATAFTLGYMESYVTMMIKELPARHQKKILADMAERTQSILNNG